jgi:hypothetical protein
MNSLRLTFITLALCLGLAAQVKLVAPPKDLSSTPQQPLTQKPKAPDSLLPRVFSGWQLQPGSRLNSVPSKVDAGNAAVLREYSFVDSQQGQYTRGNRTMTVKALRFQDATGAFGAFTFYKQPQMQPEKIGELAASAEARVLFFETNILVDVTLQRVTAMSAAELRSLADALPRATGQEARLPTLSAYLPRGKDDGFIANSENFIIGPTAMGKVDSPVPASLIDFGKSAEAATGKYKTLDGIGNMIVISYPTPQIAEAELKKIEEWHAKDEQQHPAAVDPQTGLKPVLGWSARRTGPLLVVVAGAIEDSAAHDLAAKVSYDADVTFNEANPYDKKNNIGNLVYNDMILVFIIVGFMGVVGFAFGGFRIVARRFFPHRIVDRPESVEFIRLGLQDSTDRRS